MFRQRGFTLLEMLVVMVLMGLTTTLALPAMQRWHDAVQTKAQAATLVDALRAARFRAGATRQEVVVDATSFLPVAPPSPAASDPSARPTPQDRPRDGPDAQVAPSPDRLPLALPPRWRAEKVGDIRFLANGLCKPGSILLRTERNDPVGIEVRGPLCGVELASTTGRSPP